MNEQKESVFSFGRDFLLQKKSPTGSNPARSTQPFQEKNCYQVKMSFFRYFAISCSLKCLIGLVLLFLEGTEDDFWLFNWFSP